MSTNEQKETRETRKGKITPPLGYPIYPPGVSGAADAGASATEAGRTGAGYASGASTAGYAWGDRLLKKLAMSNPPGAQIKTNTPPGVYY